MVILIVYWLFGCCRVFGCFLNYSLVISNFLLAFFFRVWRRPLRLRSWLRLREKLASLRPRAPTLRPSYQRLLLLLLQLSHLLSRAPVLPQLPKRLRWSVRHGISSVTTATFTFALWPSKCYLIILYTVVNGLLIAVCFCTRRHFKIHPETQKLFPKFANVPLKDLPNNQILGNNQIISIQLI